MFRVVSAGCLSLLSASASRWSVVLSGRFAVRSIHCAQAAQSRAKHDRRVNGEMVVREVGGVAHRRKKFAPRVAVNNGLELVFN